METLQGRAADRAFVVGDPYLPSRDIHPARRGVMRIGMVGRLAPWKGQDVFLRAFARAAAGGDQRAVIIGSAIFGEDDYASALRGLAAELGVADRVEFRGFLHNVEAQLGDLDVLVHASVLAEPFGQVIVEGMAAGLPVIASDAGGAAEIVEDGVDGLLFPPGDVDALCDALTRLLLDAPLRQRLGEAGRRRARDFRPDVIGPQMMDVYRRVRPWI